MNNTGSKLIVVLSAILFVAYGFGFALAPGYVSQAVTGSMPSSASGLIDMRATYGGMSIAVGVLLLLLSRSDLRQGLIGVLLLMLCMAVARAYGILTDGTANTLMYAYLVLEVAIAFTAGVLAARAGRNGL